MPDFSDRYGGRFLNATHVTKTFVGVIDRVEDLEIEEGKKPKPVLFLEGLDRGIVLNATRYDAMADITGSRNTDDWKPGTKVEVFKGQTKFAGKTTDCVELRAPLEDALNDAIPPF